MPNGFITVKKAQDQKNIGDFTQSFGGSEIVENPLGLHTHQSQNVAVPQALNGTMDPRESFGYQMPAAGYVSPVVRKSDAALYQRRSDIMTKNLQHAPIEKRILEEEFQNNGQSHNFVEQAGGARQNNLQRRRIYKFVQMIPQNLKNQQRKKAMMSQWQSHKVLPLIEKRPVMMLKDAQFPQKAQSPVKYHQSMSSQYSPVYLMDRRKNHARFRPQLQPIEHTIAQNNLQITIGNSERNPFLQSNNNGQNEVLLQKDSQLYNVSLQKEQLMKYQQNSSIYQLNSFDKIEPNQSRAMHSLQHQQRRIIQDYNQANQQIHNSQTLNQFNVPNFRGQKTYKQISRPSIDQQQSALIQSNKDSMVIEQQQTQIKQTDKMESSFKIKKETNDTSQINLDSKMQLIYDVLDDGDEVPNALESKINADENAPGRRILCLHQSSIRIIKGVIPNIQLQSQRVQFLNPPRHSVDGEKVDMEMYLSHLVKERELSKETEELTHSETIHETKLCFLLKKLPDPQFFQQKGMSEEVDQFLRIFVEKQMRNRQAKIEEAPSQDDLTQLLENVNLKRKWSYLVTSSESEDALKAEGQAKICLYDVLEEIAFIRESTHGMLLQYNQISGIQGQEQQQNLVAHPVIFHVEQKRKPILRSKQEIDTPYQNLLSSMDSPMRFSDLKKQGKVLQMEIQALSIQNHNLKSISDLRLIESEEPPSASIKNDQNAVKCPQSADVTVQKKELVIKQEGQYQERRIILNGSSPSFKSPIGVVEGSEQDKDTVFYQQQLPFGDRSFEIVFDEKMPKFSIKVQASKQKATNKKKQKRQRLFKILQEDSDAGKDDQDKAATQLQTVNQKQEINKIDQQTLVSQMDKIRVERKDYNNGKWNSENIDHQADNQQNLMLGYPSVGKGQEHVRLVKDLKNQAKQDSFTLATTIKNQDKSFCKSHSISEFLYGQNDTEDVLNFDDQLQESMAMESQFLQTINLQLNNIEMKKQKSKFSSKKLKSGSKSKDKYGKKSLSLNQKKMQDCHDCQIDKRDNIEYFLPKEALKYGISPQLKRKSQGVQGVMKINWKKGLRALRIHEDIPYQNSESVSSGENNEEGTNCGKHKKQNGEGYFQTYAGFLKGEEKEQYEKYQENRLRFRSQKSMKKLQIQTDNLKIEG